MGQKIYTFFRYCATETCGKKFHPGKFKRGEYCPECKAEIRARAISKIRKSPQLNPIEVKK